MARFPQPPDEIESYVGLLGGQGGERLSDEELDARYEADDLRKQFSGLDPVLRDTADGYVQNVFAGEPPVGARRRLRPTSEWLAHDATDEQVTDFLKRHNTIVDTLNKSPVIAERFAFFKGSYAGRLHDGMDQGWVSKDAGSKIDRIGSMSLHVGDMRTTVLEHKVGQYRNAFNRMTIAQGLGPNDQQREAEVVRNIFETLPHEASHIFGRWMPHWAKEGFAEHLNLVVRSGHPEVINPGARRDAQRSIYYTGERSLLHGMFHFAGAGKEAADEATVSFMRAATSEGEDSQEWKEFNTQLDRMWGCNDVFGRVSASVEAEEAMVIKQNPEWHEFQVQREATTRVKNMLDSDPRMVFGEDYKKPPHHIGATVLSETLR